MLTSTRPAELALEKPELPVQIGKYRVLRKLGEGATSEVFLCHDDFNNRDVAINRVRVSPDDPTDGRYSERFFNAEAALVGVDVDAPHLGAPVGQLGEEAVAAAHVEDRAVAVVGAERRQAAALRVRRLQTPYAGREDR